MEHGNPLQKVSQILGLIGMNAFITGSTGFIGSHLCAKLKRTNKVVALFRDIHPSPWGDWLKEALSDCVLVRGDILDDKLIRRVIANYEINHVYHLASQALVKTALKDPANTFETNITGTVNVLEACRQVGVEKVLVMSTDKVYGNKEAARESDPLVSVGIYETSKACQDLITQAYIKTYNMDAIIARSCNAYGYDLSPRIIPNTIKACMRGDPPVIYEGEETKRQYIYIEDLCEALTYLMKSDINQGIFNIATDDILTQEEVVKTICKYFPISPRPVKRERPLLEIQAQSMRPSNFGWKPRHSFEEGIQETIRRFEKHGF